MRLVGYVFIAILILVVPCSGLTLLAPATARRQRSNPEFDSQAFSTSWSARSAVSENDARNHSGSRQRPKRRRANRLAAAVKSATAAQASVAASNGGRSDNSGRQNLNLKSQGIRKGGHAQAVRAAELERAEFTFVPCESSSEDDDEQFLVLRQHSFKGLDTNVFKSQSKSPPPLLQKLREQHRAPSPPSFSRPTPETATFGIVLDETTTRRSAQATDSHDQQEAETTRRSNIARRLHNRRTSQLARQAEFDRLRAEFAAELAQRFPNASRLEREFPYREQDYVFGPTERG